MTKILIASKFFSILLLAVGLTNCSYQHNRKVIDMVQSPNKTYEIEIWRAESWSVLDVGVKYVSLTTIKDDQELTLKDPLYYEKDYDGDFFRDFETAYPDWRWLNDKVFWIGNQNELETATHKIKIINASQKKIKQIIVQSTGFFSIYELDVNEVIEIPNSFEGVKRKDIGIGLAVYYSDGTSIPGKGYGLADGLTVDRNFEDFTIVIKGITAYVDTH